MYLSEFGDNCESAEKCFQNIGGYDAAKGITIPAKSVISVDITGYEGNEPPQVPETPFIIYENEVITEEIIPETPDEGEKVIVSSSFDNKADTSAFSGMGSGRAEYSENAGLDGKPGCLRVTGRSSDWNGLSMSSAHFSDYGCRMYVSYDCMMENGGNTISCTPTFTVSSASFYPSGEFDRVVCENMEAGKWYHVEGYMSMYDNMDPGSYMLYWESPGNTDDIWLDNIEVKVLYSEKAGSFSE